jgi:putative transposase
LKPAVKKHLALWLLDQFKVSVRCYCANVTLSTSMFWYERVDKDDEVLRMRMREIALIRVRYGYWRLFVLL